MKMKSSLILFSVLSLRAGAASVITSGHLDAPGFGYANGEFEPHLHASAGAVIDGVTISSDAEFEPNELIIAVPASSTITVGSSTYYWLPEDHQAAEEADAPFVGFGLEELVDTDWAGGTVTITLLGFSGPGNFLLWQDDGLGGQNLFVDTANNLTAFTLAAGSHSHFNWGFTDNATYTLEFQISGDHVIDGVKSDSAGFTYMVPEPSSVLLGLAGMALMFRRNRVI